MDHKCITCGIGSEEVILFSCEHRGEILYLCIKCLPSLIQSPH